MCFSKSLALYFKHELSTIQHFILSSQVKDLNVEDSKILQVKQVYLNHTWTILNQMDHGKKFCQSMGSGVVSKIIYKMQFLKKKIVKCYNGFFRQLRIEDTLLQIS